MSGARWAAALLAAALATGCDTGGRSGKARFRDSTAAGATPPGSVELLVTDAPFPFGALAAARATIREVSLHAVGAVGTGSVAGVGTPDLTTPTTPSTNTPPGIGGGALDLGDPIGDETPVGAGGGGQVSPVATSAGTGTGTGTAGVGSGSVVALDQDGYARLHEGPTVVELTALHDGLSRSLGRVQVPSGTYDRLRVTIDRIDVTLLNGGQFSVPATAGGTGSTGTLDGTNSLGTNASNVPSPTAAFASSALTSGPGTVEVPLDPPLVVAPGGTSTVLLDVDLARSLVPTYRGGAPLAGGAPAPIVGFTWQPVVRAADLSGTSRLGGRVLDDRFTLNDLDDDAPVAGATVTLLRDGVPVTSTRTGPDGRFAFLGVAPGSYGLTAEAFDLQSVTRSGVTVGDPAAASASTDLRLRRTSPF